MSLTAKFNTKLMRTLTLYSLTRELALKIIRNKKAIELKSVVNNDISYSPKKVLKEIKTNGFSGIVTIGEPRLKKIIEYANSINFFSIDGQESFKIDYETPIKPSKSLWYWNEDIMNCKEVNELVYDKINLEIASNYLGKTPTIKDVRIWWSFPQEKKEYNHLYGFHYDIDSYKFLKQFIYLTDVDEKSGPHVIISNTHKEKNFFEKFNRRLTDEQVEERYEKNKINVMTGKAGSGFFEDTFAYHKGTLPEKPRLILQIEYSI